MILKTIAVLVWACGVVAAISVAIWMFIGGVSQITDGVNAEPANGTDIGWGIVRILLTGTATGLVFWAIAAIGMVFWTTGEDRQRTNRNRPSARQIERDWEQKMRNR